MGVPRGSGGAAHRQSKEWVGQTEYESLQIEIYRIGTPDSESSRCTYDELK